MYPKIIRSLAQHIKISRLVVLLSCLIALNSCYTQRDTSLLQTSKSLPQYEKADYEDYKIQVNDEVIFRLISSDEKFSSLIELGNSAGGQQTNSYRVYPDSTIDIPFIDSVKVGGLTIDEAAKSIEKRFKEIVPDAEVNLTLSNKSYTVIGEAGTGIFPIYKEKLTIYQALAQSGEILLSGDRKHVKIIRENNKIPEILEFDIRPSSIIESKYYYIYPNDIIYLQKQSSSFYKANTYGGTLGLVTSSISFLITMLYYTKLTR